MLFDFVTVSIYAIKMLFSDKIFIVVNDKVISLIEYSLNTIS